MTRINSHTPSLHHRTPPQPVRPSHADTFHRIRVPRTQTNCDDGVCPMDPPGTQEALPETPLAPPASRPSAGQRSTCASMTMGMGLAGAALGTAYLLGQSGATGTVLMVWLQWALHLIA